MNRVGPGAVKLGTIASSLSISRNSFYYYIKDRRDLITKCYLRTCDFVDTVLDLEASSSNIFEVKIKNIFRLLLSENACKFAIISDMALLGESDRKAVAERLDNQVAKIALLISQAQANGTLRDVDPTIVAHMIIGMTEWTRLWNAWTSADMTLQQRRNETSASVLSDIVLSGISASADESFICSLKFDDLTRSSYNLFDQDDANEQRRQILIGAASRLFNERGIESVSVDDIALEVGVTKGAIYHHFRDKHALVLACYERAFDLYQLINDTASETESDPLRNMLTVFYLNCQAQAAETPPLVMQPGLQSLPESILVRARSLAVHMRSIHKHAVATGSVRQSDPALVEVTAGAFFRLLKWKDRRPELSDEYIATEMTSVFLRGVVAKSSPRTG